MPANSSKSMCKLCVGILVALFLLISQAAAQDWDIVVSDGECEIWTLLQYRDVNNLLCRLASVTSSFYGIATRGLDIAYATESLCIIKMNSIVDAFPELKPDFEDLTDDEWGWFTPEPFCAELVMLTNTSQEEWFSEHVNVVEWVSKADYGFGIYAETGPVAPGSTPESLSSQSSFSESANDYSQIPQGRRDDGGFVLGDPAAPITIIAFEDFLCSHCQRYKSTVDELISQYVSKGMARFEYRFTPVVDPAYSRLSAQLAECADTLRPGAFWTAHDRLFELASARRFNDSSARSFADVMNMSYADLLECTRDASQVDIDTQYATQLEVRGTPTVFFQIGNAMPQLTPFSNQPTVEQLGTLIEQFN